MKFYKTDYVSLMEKETNFYATAIVLNNGEEIFAYCTEIEKGVYLLSDAVKIIRSQSDEGKPMILFRRYNIFTDDKFTILKDSSIVCINYLSKAFVDSYDKAIGKISEQDKQIKEIIESESSDFHLDIDISNRTLN